MIAIFDLQAFHVAKPTAMFERKVHMTHHIIIGTSGIGGALARKLVGDGNSVHLVGRNGVAVAALAAEIGATHAIADVTDAAALEAAVQAVGGQVDGLAYCVGTINLKPAHRVTDADVMRDFEVNALGALRAVRAALPALKASVQQTASILLFSTIAVQQGFASHAAVAMAKGAVEGLTRTLAAELAPKIRVNAIAPSLTRTPLASIMTNNEATANAIASLHPLQRLGEAEDIATMAALLLSPASGWITGQVIGIDGGRSTLRTKG
jgi:NAD(P)-dependent dehydrogenase (short-subunit alcohol dehydrogenase family)